MDRRTTTATVVVAAPLLLTALTAVPARAHGAPTDPVSRVSACSPEGGSRAESAACRAAIAANGAPFTAWDNLRVAGVGGRDRQTVPDGQLCSGGLPAYRGLDLARADWPSTSLSPGASLNVTYRTTIPHTGTFKLYLTKPGYDPAQPLTWSALPSQPFAEATDPPLRDGAYRFTARLPSGRSGHHVLYTVWQNSSTVDTYYSCSDVVFPSAEPTADPTPDAPTPDASGTPARAAKANTSPAARRPTPERTSSRTAEERTASPATEEERSSSPAPLLTASQDSGRPSTPLLIAGGAAAMLLAAGAAFTLLRRRGRSGGNRHRAVG
ncbi:lytic polysaccharide monooxygenase [Streptomyces sp. NPDC002845]